MMKQRKGLMTQEIVRAKENLKLSHGCMLIAFKSIYPKVANSQYVIKQYTTIILDFSSQFYKNINSP